MSSLKWISWWLVKSRKALNTHSLVSVTQLVNVRLVQQVPEGSFHLLGQPEAFQLECLRDR
jgi:hypothetical protein